MCGIYGYFGSLNQAADLVLSGLKKLDYRGYDSWGIATTQDHQIFIKKDIGKIENINQVKLPKSNLAIGHTRWATTGSVSQINAHPHFSTDHSFALVQNGIVENYVEIKDKLTKDGYKFISQTDTEVIVRLIEKYQSQNLDLVSASKKAFLDLTGRNTIVIIDSKQNQIIGLKNGSPLIIGLSNKKDFFLSSDIFSLGNNVSKYYDLNDLEMFVLNNNLKLINLNSNKEIKINYKNNNLKNLSSSKGKYRHFMIKEIAETPKVIDQVTKSNKNELTKLVKFIKSSSIKNVYTIGSGTAGNAAGQIAYFLRKIANVPVTSLIGGNALEYYSFFQKNDLIISPSQSGETADVLEVLSYAKTRGVKIASYVNMPGSMMTRISDFKLLAEAGSEICVMSTKVFTSQIAWGYLLAKSIIDQYSSGVKNLKSISSLLTKYLKDQNNLKNIKTIAKRLTNSKDIFLVGKAENFQISQEGMIKIIEGSYKHAHSIPAGDLKHYAITLIEDNVYTIAISSPENQKDMSNTVGEIKSRGGKIILISPDNFGDPDFWLKTPTLTEGDSIFNIVPLQLIAYYIALYLGNNIDKPRNIAKSVTVK